ncbi:MAG: L,D-transpeptidase family protein [Ginsengibacter sp.]|jgi:murein L,D-transpeptidase YcbB/YkuD
MTFRINVRFVFLSLIIICCNNNCKQKTVVKEKEIVTTPEQMNDQVAANIKSVLAFAKDNNGKINDSIRLAQYDLVNNFYEQNNYRSIWSTRESWLPLADSMFGFIKNSKYFGLYPSDYHLDELEGLRKKIADDSLARMDAISWTNADLMYSDAFMKTLKDLKEGRLLPDSISITTKKKMIDSFFTKNLDEAGKAGALTTSFQSLEPSDMGYQSLRTALKEFVDKMDSKIYLYINYPFKDSLAFVRKIHKRLLQSGFGNPSIALPDSVEFRKELKKYQSAHELKVDGIAGQGVVNSLNSNDNQRFKRIAITLDRYKLLPKLPQSYIWVNIPGFYLKVWNNDSLVLESKVIVGKPETHTPVLTSAISDMVTYPKWTIPESIIKKDILPALKKDPGYLDRKGFSLVDANGETVNPYTVTWSKYTKGIPWKVIQGSGDDNALGVFKFNFNNPYSVYLHDTNQRYLFKNADRALSHGCVRVEKWQALAFFIAREDSIAMNEGQTISYNADSIMTWVANKSRKRIMVKKKLPLYIEYFTCEAKNDKIVFYKDIYNDDKYLALKYFANK